MTGYVLADLIADEARDARSVVLASASSKTAIALATRSGPRAGPRIVGLTAARNLAFVE